MIVLNTGDENPATTTESATALASVYFLFKVKTINYLTFLE